MKLYRFSNGTSEVNSIASSEEAARIRAKLTDEYQLLASFDLSKDWQ
jgi:hypothetical protein